MLVINCTPNRQLTGVPFTQKIMVALATGLIEPAEQSVSIRVHPWLAVVVLSAFICVHLRLSFSYGNA
jgi:hypothetical protein